MCHRSVRDIVVVNAIYPRILVGYIVLVTTSGPDSCESEQKMFFFFFKVTVINQYVSKHFLVYYLVI